MKDPKQLYPVRKENPSEEVSSKLSNGVHNIVKGIVDSYESKVRVVTSLMREVYQKIKNYHIEQEQSINRLKDILAKNEYLRKKDFDTLMAGIRNQQEAREKEITQMIGDFCEEEEKIASKLKEILSVRNSSSLEEFKILKEEMLGRPKERERRIAQILKDFHRDQEELDTALKMLLGKGSSVRIKDFKAMVKAFQIKSKDEKFEVDKILEESERIKDEINNQWQRVMVTVGA